MNEFVNGAVSYSEILGQLLPKLLAALFCGGLVGLERELKNKAAGIKTNMLICVGSMLFTTISVMMSATDGQVGAHGDPGRIAAQIVSGIGFLGGGAILQSREHIVGLTTAATIWLVAALGVWIGLGQLWIAMTVAVMMVGVLVTATSFENRFLGRKKMFKITIHLRETSDEFTRNALEALLSSHEMQLTDYREIFHKENPEVKIVYLGRQIDHSRVLLELWKIPGILDVRQN